MEPNYPEAIDRWHSPKHIHSWPGVDLVQIPYDQLDVDTLVIHHGPGRMDRVVLSKYEDYSSKLEIFKKRHPLLYEEVLNFVETYAALTS